MKSALIVYVPVIHQGYIQLFEKYKGEADIYIINQELISEFPHLTKEIRQLNPQTAKEIIENLHVFNVVTLIGIKDLESLVNLTSHIIIPKEDIMLTLWEKYFPKKNVTLDTVFLRWDKHNTVSDFPVISDETTTIHKFDRDMMQLAYETSEKSSDWWRRVGAIISVNKKVLLQTYNHHLPSSHTPYIDGDPRNNFHKGVQQELGTSIHAEAAAIAEAARKGIALEGSSIYVNTFPCPSCAKLISQSGIKKIYYHLGYGMLDAVDIFRIYEIKIIHVK